MYRGVNLSGLDYVDGHQTPLPAAIDYYRAAGMNAFRLPIAWELIQPTIGGELDPRVVQAVRDTIVRAAPEAVMIDLHNYGRRRGKVIGTPGGATLAQFADVWRRIVRTFPGCIYSLMNEPHDQDDALLARTLNVALAAVRAVTPNALVTISLNRWANRAAFRSGAANYALWSQIRDPNPRASAIDYHCYFDPGSAGQSTVIEAGWLNDVYVFTDWCRRKGVKAFVSEFAVGADAGSVAAASQFLDYLETRQDVWLGWTWWGGGGWWRYDYPFRLDPYASRWDPGNPDAARAATWAQPLRDRPQMAMLRRHLYP